MSDLSGRLAVVTGGVSGIGLATALLLAERGAIVTVGDLRPCPDDSPLHAAGIRYQPCDVRREVEVEELIRIASPTGRLDILVNNAGVGLAKAIPDVSEAEWDRVLDTNLKGAFFTCKHAITRMRSAGGCIVNVASNAGILPRSHDPVYSISKLALVGLTRSLALCHSVDRIRVNAVCPGPVEETDMMNADFAAADDPQQLRRNLIQASQLARAENRMISPREIAASIGYLCGDDASMVTGTVLAIDGGKSLGVPPAIR
jgi:NAD(P)-dependent dehydrogenase (short-subunit alcohol dehydrogenase family)